MPQRTSYMQLDLQLAQKLKSDHKSELSPDRLRRVLKKSGNEQERVQNKGPKTKEIKQSDLDMLGTICLLQEK